MTDRPIIFSAPMVVALLDGRKSQTRRVLKLPKWAREIDDVCGMRVDMIDRSTGCVATWYPPYAPGDRLWVKEAWRVDAEWDDCPPREFDGADAIHYEADGEQRLHLWGNPFTPGRLRSPIHMPRCFSRLTLIVTDVRVQRVQEISEADAKAEGADDGFRQIVAPGNCPEPRCDGVHYGPLWHFRDIWNSIHGTDAWDANPWVAAISFTARRCNIDTMEGGTW